MHTCVCTRVHTHAHIHVHPHAHTCTCVHVHMRTRAYTRTHMDTCMCTPVHTCAHMHAHAHSHMHTCTHMHTLAHMHTCTRAHTFVHTLLLSFRLSSQPQTSLQLTLPCLLLCHSSSPALPVPKTFHLISRPQGHPLPVCQRRQWAGSLLRQRHNLRQDRNDRYRAGTPRPASASWSGSVMDRSPPAPPAAGAIASRRVSE